MYTNQQDAQIPVIILYFPLDALHVSDYIIPSSGANIYKLYIASGIGRYVCLLCGYSHTTARSMIPAYAMYSLHKLLLMMD